MYSGYFLGDVNRNVSGPNPNHFRRKLGLSSSPSTDSMAEPDEMTSIAFCHRSNLTITVFEIKRSKGFAEIPSGFPRRGERMPNTAASTKTKTRKEAAVLEDGLEKNRSFPTGFRVHEPSRKTTQPQNNPNRGPRLADRKRHVRLRIRTNANKIRRGLLELAGRPILAALLSDGQDSNTNHPRIMNMGKRQYAPRNIGFPIVELILIEKPPWTILPQATGSNPRNWMIP